MKKAWLQAGSPLVLAVLGLIFRNMSVAEIRRVPFSLSIFDSSSIESAVTLASTSQDGPNALDNQTYAWYGNQWVPPPGVPMYSKEDMRAAFSQFDTLWIGDSTGRRAYGTLFAVMNSTKAAISVADLNNYRVVDLNKYAWRGKVDENLCPTQREAANQRLVPGWRNVWTNASLCRKVGQRSFDFLRIDCIREFYEIAQQKQEIKQYTLVIIAMGLHDALKPKGCALSRDIPDSTFVTNMTRPGPYEDLERIFYKAWEYAVGMATTMEEAKKETNATTTAVLWRTSGFDSAGQESVTNRAHHLNRLTVQQFQNQSVLLSANNGTMALVDWGKAVLPRSFKPDKIGGDISAHYGLEARLLMAQMTTQQIMNIMEHSKAHRLA